MRDIKSLRLKYRVKTLSEEDNEELLLMVQHILDKNDTDYIPILGDWLKERVDETRKDVVYHNGKSDLDCVLKDLEYAVQTNGMLLKSGMKDELERRRSTFPAAYVQWINSWLRTI